MFPSICCAKFYKNYHCAPPLSLCPVFVYERVKEKDGLCVCMRDREREKKRV